MITYPRYFDPVTGMACPVELAVERLASQAAATVKIEPAAENSSVRQTEPATDEPRNAATVDSGTQADAHDRYGVSYLDAALFFTDGEIKEAREIRDQWVRSGKTPQPIGTDIMGRGKKQKPNKSRLLYKHSEVLEFLEKIGEISPPQKAGLVKHLWDCVREAGELPE